jgi:hypothetical protein
MIIDFVLPVVFIMAVSTGQGWLITGWVWASVPLTLLNLIICLVIEIGSTLTSKVTDLNRVKTALVVGVECMCYVMYILAKWLTITRPDWPIPSDTFAIILIVVVVIANLGQEIGSAFLMIPQKKQPSVRKTVGKQSTTA